MIQTRKFNIQVSAHLIVGQDPYCPDDWFNIEVRESIPPSNRTVKHASMTGIPEKGLPDALRSISYRVAAQIHADRPKEPPVGVSHVEELEPDQKEIHGQFTDRVSALAISSLGFSDANAVEFLHKAQRWAKEYHDFIQSKP